MSLIALLEKAIVERGSYIILKQHLDLIKEMLSKIEKEKFDLDKELATVKEENKHLKEEIERLKAQIPKKEFVKFEGAKFKRKPSGGFEKTVYCPICECGMSSPHDGRMPFICAQGHASTTFHKNQLPKILQELEKEFP